MPARNTLVQLLALYTNPERLRVGMHSVTDRQTDRQTDNRTMPIADAALHSFFHVMYISCEDILVQSCDHSHSINLSIDQTYVHLMTRHVSV